MTDEVMGIVRKEIRERLEEKCREIISLLPRGRTDSEINEYLWLARFHGFEDIVNVLNNVRANLAGMIIDSHNQPRRKIKQEEKKLEDYICRNGNLGKLEPGLQFVERQFSTAAGDIDILARDGDNREVIVELKTPVGTYDKRTALDEIRGYLEDRKDARAILAVPHIDFWLYSRLKGFVDDERLKIMLVGQNGEEYTFRTLQDEDVKVTSKNQREAIKRKAARGEEAGVISLIKKAREVREPQLACKERVPKMDHDDLVAALRTDSLKPQPLYYQVLVVARPEVEDKARYLRPLEISAEQMRGLEGLIRPDVTEEAISVLERVSDLRERFAEFQPFVDKVLQPALNAIGGEKILRAAHAKIKKYEEALISLKESFGNMVLEVLTAKTPKEIDAIMKAAQTYSRDISRIYTFARYNDEDLKKSRTLWCKIRKKFKTLKNPAERERVLSGMESLLAQNDFSVDGCDAQIASLRARRAEKLMEIDQNLALSYLGYCFVHGCTVFREIRGETLSEEERKAEFKGFTVGARSYAEYLKADTEVYKSIINQALRVREEQKPAETTFQIISQPARAEIRAAPVKIETPYETLRKSIANGHAENLSPDSRERIRYFVEEDAPRYALGNPTELTEAFSQFNLSRKIRKKQDAPSDLQFRNFMDDVTLMLARGSVPSHQDLERLYQNSRSEK